MEPALAERVAKLERRLAKLEAPTAQTDAAAPRFEVISDGLEIIDHSAGVVVAVFDIYGDARAAYAQAVARALNGADIPGGGR